MKKIEIYRRADGSKPFTEWVDNLRNRQTAQRIRLRVSRLAEGNPGDAKSVGKGVRELRLHFGPGYRVYYAERGDRIILLLCGGDKSTQARDISAAQLFLEHYDESANDDR